MANKKIITRTVEALRSSVKKRLLVYVCMVSAVLIFPNVTGCVPHVTLETAITEAKKADTILKHANFIITENPEISYTHALQIVDAVHEASEKYGVTQQIILCLMSVESAYIKNSKSSKGALGLMQVYPKVWLTKQENSKDLVSAGIAETKKDLLDVETNIMAGAYILRVYLDEAAKKNIRNPYKYAITRYYGGYKNSHYTKTMAVMARLKNFKHNKGVYDENS